MSQSGDVKTVVTVQSMALSRIVSQI